MADTKERCRALVRDHTDMVSCGEIAVPGTELCKEHLVRRMEDIANDIDAAQAKLDSLLRSRAYLIRALDAVELPLLARLTSDSR